jgi:ring-1,2-phenylacetyl-CoA epoxidase subunit PaaA
MSVQELEKIFQDKVDAEVRIEPKDWIRRSTART